MREPPLDLAVSDLLAVVRGEWDPEIDRLDHLRVGFGAHHWAAYSRERPSLFVTVDVVDARRSLDVLEAAYAGAVVLHRSGLEFVLAPLLSTTGSPIVRFADRAVSCTPWRSGTSGGELNVPWTADALARLHAAVPPPSVPRWQPVVTPGFADDLRLRLGEPWGPGPYAEDAHHAVGERLADIRRWTSRYHELGRRARTRRWVPTHGEPHSHNQLVTGQERYLVDWETLKLAPPERDVRELVDAGAPVAADPDMVEMFGLEWRLAEIDEYTNRFAAEHRGTEDDQVAFEDLLHELTRN